MRILITGGAGFIGSALIRHLILHTNNTVLNIDSLTYAGNQAALSEISENPRYHFARINICDRTLLREAVFNFSPHWVMNLAAESHVDRSIESPALCVETNVLGTCNLLESIRDYWNQLPPDIQKSFRFLHVSTDEVFGSLDTGLFREDAPCRPSSPYAASKASADHLVRAWHHTYGLPTIVSHCSNNYGPYQYPEKLIPLIILNALAERPLPIYGKGINMRDWIYVDDHIDALMQIIKYGQVGNSYNISGQCEHTNLNIVHMICNILDKLHPRVSGTTHADLITFVADRPGHDYRYAIDSSKISSELGFHPKTNFVTGLRNTISWYINNHSTVFAAA